MQEPVVNNMLPGQNVAESTNSQMVGSLGHIKWVKIGVQ